MLEKYLIIIFGEKNYKIRTSWIQNFAKIVKRPWTFIRTPRVQNTLLQVQSKMIKIDIFGIRRVDLYLEFSISSHFELFQFSALLSAWQKL